MDSSNKFHDYHVYGLHLRSQWSLPYPETNDDCPIGIELLKAAGSLQQTYNLSDELLAESQSIRLSDDSTYVYWPNLMEFVVSADGRRIFANPLMPYPSDTIQAYFFGGVFSFALLKLGIEQLHAAAVVIGDHAIGFMGDAGFGKSSLAAAFIERGYPLLTDDLLVIHARDNALFAQPGLPRLKLFADSAATLRSVSREVTVNRVTGKQMIRLERQQFHESEARLRVLYTLIPTHGESDAVYITQLAQHKAFVEICKAAFNARVTTTNRLKEQFRIATCLTSSVPVKQLSFPRSFGAVSRVCESILADVRSGYAEAGAIGPDTGH